jgi:DNA-binding GntR family transcriptional regulator
MTVRNAKPKSNTQVAFEEIRGLIFTGELGAGSSHLESELAEMLGMSRTPVREAALMLEAQGLLELRPRKGVRILPVSVDDMREIYEILTELESHAAENAASRDDPGADLDGLEQSIRDMDEAIEVKDLEAWARADQHFHSELVRLGGNSRIVLIAAMMAAQVQRARATTLPMRVLPRQSNDDHRAVLEAIRNGDAVSARRIHRAHRQRAKEEIIGLLEKYRLHRL